jgi:addiction module HigA family antidote
MATKRKPVGGKPTHPGEILREDILPALGRDMTEIAKALGVSRRQLYEITGERRAITAPMALRIAKLIGARPEFWLELQNAYDLDQAAEELKNVLPKIPALHTPRSDEELPPPAKSDPPREVPADLGRVSIAEDWEVRYWAKHFKVSPAELRAAVERAKGNAGVPVTAVARVLGKAA